MIKMYLILAIIVIYSSVFSKDVNYERLYLENIGNNLQLNYVEGEKYYFTEYVDYEIKKVIVLSKNKAVEIDVDQVEFPKHTSVYHWVYYKEKFYFGTNNGFFVYSQETGTVPYTKYNFDLILNRITSLTSMRDKVVLTNNTGSIFSYESDSLRRINLASNFDSIPPYNTGVHNLAQIDDKYFYSTHDGTFCYYDFNEDQIYVYRFDSFEGENEESFNIDCITSFDDKIYILTDQGRLHIWHNGDITFLREFNDLLTGEDREGTALSYSDIFFDWDGRVYISMIDYNYSTGRILNRFMLIFNYDFEIVNVLNANEEFGDGLTVASMSTPHKNISDSDDKRVFFTAEGENYYFDTETSVIEKVEIFNNLYVDKMYPNPCNDHISLEIMLNPHKKDNLSFSIINYLGQEILSPEYTNEYDATTGYAYIEITLDNLPSGYYYILIDNGSDKVLRPIIVQ
jgi:hypothetical protein